MQPPPDAVGEFRSSPTTERRVRPRRRRDGQRRLPQRHQPVPRRRLGVLPRHRAERRDLLQAGRRLEAAAAPQPVRRRARRTDREEQGVLLRRLRRLPPGRASSTAFSTHADRGAERRASCSVDVRDPRTGVDLPGRHADSDDRVRAQVLGGLPAPNVAGAANNYSIAAGVHQRHRQGRRQDRPAGQPGAVAVRPLRLARPRAPTISRRFRCRRAAAATATSTRATSSSVLGATYIAGGASLLEVRFGWSNTAGRQESAGARHASAHEASASPGCRPIRASPAACRRSASPATRTFGRQATNPQWQYPTVWNPKVNYSWLMGRQSLKAGYEFQHINVEVQDVNPLYGRDTYTGQFTRPAGAAANNLYNLADFMLGLRSQYALSNVLVADMRAGHALRLRAGRLRVNDRLTLNLGLRYEYATPMWEANNVLTNFDPVTKTMITRQGRIDLRSRAGRSRSQQLRSAPRLRLHADGQDRASAAAGASATCTSTASASANLLGINGPQVISAVVNQTPTAAGFVPTEQGYPAGLTDPVAVQPADRATSPTSRATSTRARCRAGTSRCSASSARTCCSTSPTSATRRRPAAGRATTTRRRRTTPPARFRWRRGGRFRTSRDITYVFNGGKSRYNALPDEVRVADGRRRDTPQLADAVEGARTTAPARSRTRTATSRRRRTSTTSTPTTALSGYHQPYNSTTSFVWSLPFGKGKRWGSDMSTGDGRAGRRLAAGRHQHASTPGER